MVVVQAALGRPHPTQQGSRAFEGRRVKRQGSGGQNGAAQERRASQVSENGLAGQALDWGMKEGCGLG